jgi:DMSO/TMAO reductase YedYZ molybdopterin-dependent catalytic subunit
MKAQNQWNNRERTVNEKALRQRALVSFVIFLILGTTAYGAWLYLYKMPRNTEGRGVNTVVRKTLEANERFFAGATRQKTLSKTYPKSMAAKVARVNGAAGLANAADTANWHLRLVRQAGDTLMISLADLKKLPKTEIIFDFKCIEGWDQISHWGGVKFKDFMKHYGLTEQEAMKYVGLVTPDRGYYVGVDMASALHEQTLLCYELNGAPLPVNQGYPLRLIIPVKYGIKHLKRIGTLYFSNTPPPDYWAERGYDYYSGL